MNLRTYDIDGKKATFNKEGFKHLLQEKKRADKVTFAQVEDDLSQKLNVAPNTVHKWLYNGGGPSDYDMVMQLAEILGLSDASLLLNYHEDGGKNMVSLTDRQLSAVKRIYDGCVWFLYEFRKSNGFNDYWFRFTREGSAHPEDDIANLADSYLEKVQLVVDQEYFDLHDCEIYDVLSDFVYVDLLNTYDGKLSYAYRFEAGVDGNPTTIEDYDRAMIRLNEIIANC